MPVLQAPSSKHFTWVNSDMYFNDSSRKCPLEIIIGSVMSGGHAMAHVVSCWPLIVES